MPRTRPSQGFLKRESQRVWLTGHFAVMLVGLAILALVNRALTPDRLWVPWVALAWGIAFLAHLSAFSRETLGTMLGRRHDLVGKQDPR